jgi:hypothetical protein
MDMLVAPTITSLARRFGPQLLMACGAFFLATGFTGASFARHIWHLYFTQGVLVGFGVGFLYQRRDTTTMVLAAAESEQWD